MSGQLQHTPAEIIRQLIIDLSLGIEPDGSTTDWQVYNNVLPDISDNAIVVTDTEPVQEGRSMPTGEYQEHYGFQVKVRGTTDLVAFRKAHAIQNAFAVTVKRTKAIVGGYNFFVFAISKTSGPLPFRAPNSSLYFRSLNCVVALIQQDSGTG